MKKIIYGALLGLFAVIAILGVTAATNGAPILTYVYSNSMEPLIKTNDAFFVWPSADFKIGDIVTYRPIVLKAAYVTHRIIAVGENGYITKGDNSPYPDQESGEPQVTPGRIIGKVITVNGQPLLIPGLGKLTSGLQSKFGNYAKYLALLFLISALLSMLFSLRRNLHRRKPRRRWRLRHIYRAVTLLSAVSVVISIYAGSRVTQVEYLVSEYPGNQGNQTAVGQPGTINLQIKNNGFFPVWTMMKGTAPLSADKAPEYLKPHSATLITVNVGPQRETGVYHGYIQVYNYPALLPRNWLIYLHGLEPFYAILAEGLTMGLWFSLLFVILNRIHGFEDWIPLRAVRDKILYRRIKHMKAGLLGRRRVR